MLFSVKLSRKIYGFRTSLELSYFCLAAAAASHLIFFLRCFFYSVVKTVGKERELEAVMLDVLQSNFAYGSKCVMIWVGNAPCVKWAGLTVTPGPLFTCSPPLHVSLLVLNMSSCGLHFKQLYQPCCGFYVNVTIDGSASENYLNADFKPSGGCWASLTI